MPTSLRVYARFVDLPELFAKRARIALAVGKTTCENGWTMFQIVLQEDTPTLVYCTLDWGTGLPELFVTGGVPVWRVKLDRTDVPDQLRPAPGMYDGNFFNFPGCRVWIDPQRTVVGPDEAVIGADGRDFYYVRSAYVRVMDGGLEPTKKY